jgi:hypothetical protein
VTNQAPSGDLSWPRELRWLGYAGLIPFLACLAVLILANDSAWLARAIEAMRYYAAVIASFLGAVQWGVAGDPGDRLRRARLLWGVMPALIAWVLLAIPGSQAFAGFAILFAFIIGVDLSVLPLLDASYRRLRLKLSAVVIATLITAALVAPGTPA